MNQSLVKELLTRSLAKQITFPEILAILTKEGFESYHVDFLRNEVRSYRTNGESFVSSMAFIHDGVSPGFSADKLEEINKRVGSGKAAYVDFVKESTAAGCAYYVVYLHGRKVRYFGRDGGEHIQDFPSSI